MVYLRPGSPGEVRTGDLALRWVRPWMTEQEMFVMTREHSREVNAELRRLKPDRFLNPDECLSLGVTAMVVEDPQLAERFFRKGLALAPNHPVLGYILTMALDDKGRRQEWLEGYRKLEKQNPGSPMGPVKLR